MPPLRPDVAIVHAQRASAAGDTQVWGLLGCQKEAAFAADRVIVVVEEVVSEDVIRADPNRTIIPGLIVDAVVVEPWGAHPSYVQGAYDRDNRFYLDWDPISARRGRDPGLAARVGLRPRRSRCVRREARAERLAGLRPGPRRPVPSTTGRTGERARAGSCGMNEPTANVGVRGRSDGHRCHGSPDEPDRGSRPIRPRGARSLDGSLNERSRRVSAAAFSKSEMMIVAAARALEGEHVCFVGVGLPNIAVNLAKRTVAPDLELVYEAGVFGARPARLPLSIGDPTIVTGSTAVVSMLELFGYYLQRGLVDVGFLGAAQIDRFGNINTTVIGDYAHPTTRLPGSGGACEIAINARQVFVIMRQSRRSFVDRIDFRTSPGNLGGAEQAERIRREGGWLGRGPSIVVTDLGVYHFDETGEMRLDALHPGATLDGVRETIGWDIKVAARPGRDPGADRRTSCGSSARSSIPRASTRSRRAVSSARARLDGPPAPGTGALRTTWSETLPMRKRPTRPAAVAADHDQVRALRRRRLDDRLARVALPHQEVDGHADRRPRATSDCATCSRSLRTWSTRCRKRPPGRRSDARVDDAHRQQPRAERRRRGPAPAVVAASLVGRQVGRQHDASGTGRDSRCAPGVPIG